MYNVVLRENGVLTWTSLRTEKEFNDWCSAEGIKPHDVVAKGISESECENITLRKNSVMSVLTAALRSARTTNTIEEDQLDVSNALLLPELMRSRMKK